MYLPIRIFLNIISSLFFISTTVSVILIIIGILGIILSSLRHTPHNMWVKKMKIGIVIFIITAITYVGLQYVFSALGMGMSSSFTGDTQVWTSKGKVRISALDVGDEVMGLDIKTNTIVSGKIEMCRSYKVNSYYLINRTLKVTSEHPMGVRKSGNIIWKKAKELAAGDELVAAEAIVPLVIESIEEVQSETPITVYNPQVSGSNNYFVYVKNNAALVHNKTTLPKLEPPQRCEHSD
ncbi:MAG TPA: Hint domain-containing protein [Candidatus Limnocylindrales bacterium]|nr:Hint domain-containing protein [Candidatus Limnocylindrales bacterium]